MAACVRCGYLRWGRDPAREVWVDTGERRGQ